MSELAQAIKRLDEKARDDRGSFESEWEDIANHVLPREATFTERTPKGKDRRRHVLDSTAPQSVELFASQLNSLLTNPAKQWFRLNFGQTSAETPAPLKKWGEEVETIMLDRLRSDAVNTPGHFHNQYLSLGAFGTSVLFVDTDPQGRLRLQSPHLQDVAFFENPQGFVDRVFRRFRITPVQAQQQFQADNDELSESLAGQKAEQDPYKEVDMVHGVFPIDGSQPDLEQKLPARVREANNANFASVWIAPDDQAVIRTSFYVEMPYMVPRWYKVRQDRYGRSPAMTAMPDIRMVNRMQETILRGAEKLVDPPLTVPDGGIVSPVRLQPGGITYTEGQAQPQPLIPTGASRIDVGGQLLAQKQTSIRQAFFVSLFMTQESPVKTATQVAQEVDERNRALAPMLLRLQAELLQPFVRRVFGLLWRGGAFNDPPDTFDIGDVDVDFVSPLTSSQKQEEALGLQRLMEVVLTYANADEGVLDLFDTDEIARVAQEGTGAPDRILRNEAEIRRLRQRRAEQQRRQERLEQINQGAEAAADLGQAIPTGGG